MIVVNNLSKRYDENILFKDVNFFIPTNKKIGLVGRNGCGKTTLFRILTGQEEPTEGDVSIINENIGYVTQEIDLPDEMIGIYLEDCVKHPTDLYKIEKYISKLRFENYDPYQYLNTLSEGQKMKVKLIEILLSNPTTLLIDEPTNHLDIEGIEWFEEYINSLNMSVVMISHDREFLNNVVDEIWEIEREGIIKFSGNYDYYQQEKNRLIEKWDKLYKAQEKKRKKLEELLENARRIKSSRKRGGAVGAAKTRIERLEKDQKERYSSESIENIDIEAEVHSSKLMLRLKDVSKSYGKNKVFEDLNLEVRGGEKVWLFGPNGAGKSTLVKIINGIEKVDSGEVRLGDNIRVGYFSQIQPNVEHDRSILEEFTSRTGCFYGKAYGYLEKFLFKREDLNKKVYMLSPGERARFEFAIFSFFNYDMLLLDEPDNHLDIDTKEILEQSLSEYIGTMLLVSHDRYFVGNSGVSKVLNLKDGKLRHIL
jgi:ATP-binding cassette subfamily F protein 3